MPRTRRRRRCCGPGATWTGSKAVRPCAPGCTESPRTRAWMNWTAADDDSSRRCSAARAQAFIPGGGLIDETPWLEPFPDAWLEVPDSSPGPEARYETRESIELAFVAALQRLGPRQRAVLLLRDVLGWSARDVAGLLDVSVQAANSSLQRARARLDPSATPSSARLAPADERALVERYVGAWERGDVQAFAALLAEDVVLSMPPLAEWYVGAGRHRRLLPLRDRPRRRWTVPSGADAGQRHHGVRRLWFGPVWPGVDRVHPVGAAGRQLTGSRRSRAL